MNALDRIIVLNKNRIKIQQNIVILRKLGDDLSEAECNYKKALYATMRKLKKDDDVTWSAVERYSHGHPDVAEARLKRDKVKHKYYSYLRENKVLYQEIDIQEKEIDREYKIRRINA